MLIESGQECPYCGSSDARAEYETNWFCFSCHRSDRKSTKNPRQVITTHKDEHIKFREAELPKIALAYLYKLHFSLEEIQSLGIMWKSDCEVWSKKYNNYCSVGDRLYLPASDDEGDLKTLSKHKLKCLSTNPTKCLGLFVNKNDSPVILVEDLLSAYRLHLCGYNVVSLRGTSCSASNFALLRKLGDEYLIWLDSDRPGRSSAKKLKKRLEMWDKKCDNVSTEEDPKHYNKIEIRSMLHGKACFLESE